MGTKKIQSGVLNLGFYYEELVPAYFALELLQDKDVKDFKLTLNPSSFSKFDDLIVNITHKDGSEDFAIQLKHRESQRESLDVQEFYRKGKAFEIVQYKHAYEKMNSLVRQNYKVFLFTNAHFENIETSKIYKINAIEPNFKTALFNMNNILQFQEKKSKKVNSFYQNFFVFSQQKSCSDLREAIVEQIHKDFSSDRRTAEFYISFFGDLRKAFYNNTEINKKTLMLKMIELLLLEFLIDFPLDHKHANSRTQLIKKVLRKFHVTVCSVLPATKFTIEQFLKNLDTDEVEEIMSISKEHKMIFNNGIMRGITIPHLVAYFKEKLLFVKINNKSIQTVISVINLSKDVKNFDIKFVLVDEENMLEKDKFQTENIFQHLIDLKQVDEGLYENITKAFKISLQGRTSKTIKVLQTDYNVFLDGFITPNMLFQSIDSDLIIGRKMKKIPKSYIKRYLTISTISTHSHQSISTISLLENLCKKEQISTIHCGDYLKSFKSYLEENNFGITVVEEIEETVLNTPILYLSNEEECNDCFTHLKLVKNKDLDWTLFKIKPNDPKIFNDKLNIIYGKPLGGNTTIIKCLMNNCPLNYWVVYVSLKELSLNFTNIDESELFFENLLKHEDVTTRQLMKLLKDSKNWMFFFDDLRNLSHNNMIKTVKAIEYLSKNGYACWISCLKELEKTLKSTITIDNVFLNEDLEPEEQKLFITRYITNKNVQKYDINFDCMSMLRSAQFESDILKTPVFLKILTMMINTSKNFKSFSDFLNIAEIYLQFINKQIKHRVSDNKNFANNIYKNLYIEKCQVAALKACLQREDFEILNINNRKTFLQEIKTNGDFFGLILEVNKNDSVVFIHPTLAECLAAVWLKDNFKQIVPEKRKFIFKSDYIKIQYFLNLLLARGCPLHLAIYNKKFDRVVEFAEKNINDLDKAGRNSLHIASSLGIKHAFSIQTNTIRQKIILSKREEIKIFEYLLSKLENNSILKKDEFFEMNSFQYADASLSLGFLEELSKKEELQLEYLDNYNNLSALSKACVKFGYITILKRVFEWEKLENLEGKDMPFLHLALANNQIEIALFLFQKETNFNKVDYFDKTALHFAASCNCITIVQKLLGLNVNMEAADLNGKTPLHLAAEMGHKEIVECLVTKGANVNARDKKNRMPLHESSSLGKKDVVQYLTEHNKIDLFALDGNGYTALYLAEEHQHHEVVEILTTAEKNKQRTYEVETIRKNIQEEIQYISKNTEERNEHNETNLHLAAREGSEEFLEILLNENADTSAKNCEGRIPLHLASELGHVKIVQHLLKEKDINCTDNEGLTPLHLAAENGHKDIVCLLIESGAKILPLSKKDETPLHCAILRGHKDIVNYYISKNIDGRTKKETYLHVAAKCRETEIMYYLLEKWKMYINKTDTDGRTPLHYAVKQGLPILTSVLIQAGAIVNIKDCWGNTPLDIAKKDKRNDIEEIISSRENVL